jgi:uncharacterized membrane protein YtjA (UPF0391 family)
VSYILRWPGSRTDYLAPPLERTLQAIECVDFRSNKEGALMLHYAVVFFVIALIAAFFGFGGIAVGAAGIAKVLFVVFLIGAIVSFLMSLGRRV